MLNEKIATVLFYIAIVIVILVGMYCCIYEYLIWDKSAIPNIVTNIIVIIGLCGNIN